MIYVLYPHFAQTKDSYERNEKENSEKFEEFSALQPKFGSDFGSYRPPKALKMLKIFSSMDLTFAKKRKKNQFF